MEVMQQFLSGGTAIKLILTIALALVCYGGAQAGIKIVYRQNLDLDEYYRLRKMIGGVFTVIYVVAMLIIWSEAQQSLVTYIGLLSAGLAVALRDIFYNMIACLFIITRRPFKVGDRIHIHNVQGDVIDIRLFHFSVIETYDKEVGGQSSGRFVDIPCYYVFTYPLTNEVKGFGYVWDELSVTLTPDSNWQKAKVQLTTLADNLTKQFAVEAEEAVQQAGEKYMIIYRNYTPIVYTSINETGVVLTLRYICSVKQERSIQNQLWEDILKMASNETDIQVYFK